MKHNLFVLSGPSGVGKGTMAKLLKERLSDLAISISCTTRAPRAGEVDGKDYIFLTRKEFLDKANSDGFYEYSEHFDNFYGTPKDYVSKSLETKDVLLEIDVNGGELVKKQCPEAILIFLKPPSLEALRQRLTGRNTESYEKVEKRLERLPYEYSLEREYDYVVVNDDLESAYNEIVNIIKKHKGE